MPTKSKTTDSLTTPVSTSKTSSSTKPKSPSKKVSPPSKKVIAPKKVAEPSLPPHSYLDFNSLEEYPFTCAHVARGKIDIVYPPCSELQSKLVGAPVKVNEGGTQYGGAYYDISRLNCNLFNPETKVWNSEVPTVIYLTGHAADHLTKHCNIPITKDEYNQQVAILTSTLEERKFTFDQTKGIVKLNRTIDTECPFYKKLAMLANVIGLRQTGLDLLSQTSSKGTKVDSASCTVKEILDISSQFPPNKSYGFISTIPSVVNFDSTEKMRALIEEHCKAIPGFKITDLTHHLFFYRSDGNMECTPDAINHPSRHLHLCIKCKDASDYQKMFLQSTKAKLNLSEIFIISAPVIYAGTGWCVEFTIGGVNPISGCRVMCAPWDEFASNIGLFHPTLLDGIAPWSDIVFICSDWCERNRAKELDKHINLQTPTRRRMSLLSWILGPMLERARQSGLTIPGFSQHIPKPDLLEKMKTFTAKPTLVLEENSELPVEEQLLTAMTEPQPKKKTTTKAKDPLSANTSSTVLTSKKDVK